MAWDGGGVGSGRETRVMQIAICHVERSRDISHYSTVLDYARHDKIADPTHSKDPWITILVPGSGERGLPAGNIRRSHKQ